MKPIYYYFFFSVLTFLVYPLNANKKRCSDHFPKKARPPLCPYVSLISSNQNKLKKNVEFVTANTNKNIYRYVPFKIPVQKEIFDALFSDLVFAVKMARRYTSRKYEIKNINENDRQYYSAFDGLKTEAVIMNLFKTNHLPPGSPLGLPNISNESVYIYFVNGTYDSVIDISGSLILDVRFKKISTYRSAFYINTYIMIDNFFIRGMSRFLMAFPDFKEKIYNLIDCTILNLWKTGYVTARKMKRDWDELKNTYKIKEPISPSNDSL